MFKIIIIKFIRKCATWTVLTLSLSEIFGTTVRDVTYVTLHLMTFKVLYIWWALHSAILNYSCVCVLSLAGRQRKNHGSTARWSITSRLRSLTTAEASLVGWWCVFSKLLKIMSVSTQQVESSTSAFYIRISSRRNYKNYPEKLKCIHSSLLL